eukprot:m.189415 g.189415  ORF g.189415 m.189415 type:complete len:633 (+) comp18206_c0_seq1:232-2130(+)
MEEVVSGGLVAATSSTAGGLSGGHKRSADELSGDGGHSQDNDGRNSDCKAQRSDHGVHSGDKRSADHLSLRRLSVTDDEDDAVVFADGTRTVNDNNVPPSNVICEGAMPQQVQGQASTSTETGDVFDVGTSSQQSVGGTAGAGVNSKRRRVSSTTSSNPAPAVVGGVGAVGAVGEVGESGVGAVGSVGVVGVVAEVAGVGVVGDMGAAGATGAAAAQTHHATAVTCAASTGLAARHGVAATAAESTGVVLDVFGAGDSGAAAGVSSDATAVDAPPTEQHIRGRLFRVGPRYTIDRFLGEGRYGIVCSALDTEGPGASWVAIKKIDLRATEFNLRFAQTCLREVELCRQMNHDNIVQLRRLLGSREHMEVYFVFELMDTDLRRVLTSHGASQSLTADHVRFFSYQLLRGVKYLHSGNVLHRDLKPENILVTASGELKIADLGLARVVNEQTLSSRTEYVASRWYRAPEVILQPRGYGTAMDLWSVGAIIAELVTRRPIFRGTHVLDQIFKIFMVIGTPSSADLTAAISNNLSAPARIYLSTLPRCDPVSFSDLLLGADPNCVELVRRLLLFQPEQRLTAAEALSMPYFGGVGYDTAWHDPGDEPTMCGEPEVTGDLEKMAFEQVLDKLFSFCP